MTRLTSIAALLFALVALPGCPDDNTNTDEDMTVSTGDMAVKGDMAVAPGSCAAFLACAQTCTTPAMEATCLGACQAKVMGAMAGAALAALATCQASHCLPDMGTGCAMGSLMPACQTCIQTNCLTQVTACMQH